MHQCFYASVDTCGPRVRPCGAVWAQRRRTAPLTIAVTAKVWFRSSECTRLPRVSRELEKVGVEGAAGWGDSGVKWGGVERKPAGMALKD